MRKLYPSIEPIEVDHLEMPGGHQIYVELCGKKDGIPVIFLHGGPGGGCKPDHRRFFDSDIYQIILFDQRGSGRSMPLGGTENNSTDLLVSDMEAIRKHYRIESWLIFAGSWGSALALLYAESFPERVLGLILRASFLARQCDLDWFAGDDGVSKILPREWRDFGKAIDFKSASSQEVVSHLHDMLNSSDEKIVMEAALAWEKWSGAVVSYSFENSFDSLSGTTESTIVKAKIELHYAVNKYFLEPDQLLRDIANVPGVPVKLIHGGRDMTCLPASSWLLHSLIPNSKLEIIRTAGHLSGEEKMIDALVRATTDIAKEL